MHDGAFEEIGERCQADVRMRSHIVVRAGLDVDRAEVVEEDERADGAAVGLRQQAAHREAAAEIAGLRGERLQSGHAFSFCARAGRAELAASSRTWQPSR